jgi:hypothetical protein
MTMRVRRLCIVLGSLTVLAVLSWLLQSYWRYWLFS